MRYQLTIRILIIILLLILPHRSHNVISNPKFHQPPPFYTHSISALQSLAQEDYKVVRTLTQAYLTLEEINVKDDVKNLLESYLIDFYETSGFTDIGDNLFTKGKILSFNNPIGSLRLIRRGKFMLRDLSLNFRFQKLIIRDPLSEPISNFWKKGWPQFRDLDDAIDGILRLDEMYNLDTELFAKGWISGKNTTFTLRSTHCYEIGIWACKIEKFAQAIKWLTLAKEMALSDKGSSLVFIEFLLQNSVEIHQETARRFSNPKYELCKGTRNEIYDKLNYWDLCSGKSFQSERTKSHLFCWYEFKAHAHFEIGPMKMEFLARNPDIVQIYQVLHDKEIQNLISQSQGDMLPSTIQDSYLLKNGNKHALSSLRTSVSSWMGSENCTNIARKIEHITGLHAINLSSAEALQVASYSFGGHFFPHYDEGTNVKESEIRRIATFMIYLNDVEVGGKTAFTYLGLSIQPVKGSALFWHNLQFDGEPDPFTRHGACPVLLGQKWVANKWILSGDQFLKRQCGMKLGQRYQIPVNKKYLAVPRDLVYDNREDEDWRKSGDQLSKQKCTVKLSDFISYGIPVPNMNFHERLKNLAISKYRPGEIECELFLWFLPGLLGLLLILMTLFFSVVQLKKIPGAGYISVCTGGLDSEPPNHDNTDDNEVHISQGTVTTCDLKEMSKIPGTSL